MASPATQPAPTSPITVHSQKSPDAQNGVREAPASSTTTSVSPSRRTRSGSAAFTVAAKTATSAALRWARR
ncbi:hypothetical protein [Streptomyces sp. NPDC046909]|uniref:hypothetical protein n=1 Tax=Streptomyces sp. NPDC046909 TaxID=3155617 RepID=UPI0034109CA9